LKVVGAVAGGSASVAADSERQKKGTIKTGHRRDKQDIQSILKHGHETETAAEAVRPHRGRRKQSPVKEEAIDDVTAAVELMYLHTRRRRGIRARPPATTFSPTSPARRWAMS
jgi:hypothetical protein